MTEKNIKHNIQSKRIYFARYKNRYIIEMTWNNLSDFLNV